MTRRRRSKRRVTANAVRRSLLVFVEGKVTEEEYLHHFRKLHRHNVTVEFGSFRGTPLSLVKAAVAAKTDGERMERRGKGSAHDEVWCVFDVDQHPFLQEAISLAYANGITVAVSNPCIELWFVLHFSDQTAYIGRGQAQAAAKGYMCCEKSLTTSALSLLEESYEQARNRARQLDVKHHGDATPAPGNPSSGVWKIVDSISRRTA